MNLLLSDHELLVVISLWIYHTLFEIHGRDGQDGQTLIDCLLPHHPSTFVLNTHNGSSSGNSNGSSSIPGIVGLGVPLLTAATLSNIYHITKESGINLPLYVILGLNHLVLEEYSSTNLTNPADPGGSGRSGEYMTTMIQYNIVNMLQQICISCSNSLDEDLKEVAKQQLLVLMSKSATVRESVLSAHFSLSIQLQAIPEVVLPEKSVGAK